MVAINSLSRAKVASSARVRTGRSRMCGPTLQDAGFDEMLQHGGGSPDLAGRHHTVGGEPEHVDPRRPSWRSIRGRIVQQGIKRRTGRSQGSGPARRILVYCFFWIIQPAPVRQKSGWWMLVRSRPIKTTDSER